MNLKTKPSIENLKILAVDDNKNFIELLERKLRLHSDKEIHIECFTDPEEALNQVKENYYDAIIVDYRMPDMDGLELLKKVRNENSIIPFIIETNDYRPEMERKAYTKGATAVMRKSSEDEHYEGILRNIRQEAQHYRACKGLKG